MESFSSNVKRHTAFLSPPCPSKTPKRRDDFELYGLLQSHVRFVMRDYSTFPPAEPRLERPVTEES